MTIETEQIESTRRLAKLKARTASRVSPFHAADQDDGSYRMEKGEDSDLGVLLCDLSEVAMEGDVESEPDPLEFWAIYQPDMRGCLIKPKLCDIPGWTDEFFPGLRVWGDERPPRDWNLEARQNFLRDLGGSVRDPDMFLRLAQPFVAVLQEDGRYRVQLREGAPVTAPSNPGVFEGPDAKRDANERATYYNLRAMQEQLV